MKTTLIAENVEPAQVRFTAERTQKRMTRISPFLLLVLFLLVWFPYSIISSGNLFSAWLIIIPFLIANVSLADFAIWNYFGGKKKLLIWVSEAVISALILYWLF
ncbi:MAG TPA: hypothetical protein VEV83_05935 [Parafilimonas sp.]|nr:hypothetical protein [Parafilimonas sp.]